MGNIYYNLMKYGKARMFYRKSLWINQELNNIEGIAIAYNNLASFYYYEGNYDKAINYLNYASKYDQKLPYKGNLAEDYKNLGVIHETMGNNQKAKYYLIPDLSIKIFYKTF